MKKYTVKDYKSKTKPIWCPGCGNYGILNAIYRALEQLQIPTHKIGIISGIGCAGRLPGYMGTYGFNGVHGRVLPVATGAKMANLDNTIIAVGGDGDGYSIGAGHISHAARKNIDITYIVMDNGIYGLTKGQASPTTPLGVETKTTYYGNLGATFNPIRTLIAYKASFVARIFSADIKHSTDIIAKAITHRGFSFVEVLSPCVTFRGKDQYDYLREKSFYIPESYDPSNEVNAFDYANDEDVLELGIIYKKSRPTYDEALEEVRIKAKKDGVPSKLGLLNNFEV
ncbi:MAG: 2-oxoacid:ferredoxin oxidoreductase subunit beta [Candidatus Marinimicrobia bacterium]|jgi:2-oxoglutarate ferredoxin oxidoreductase subunit beta|nr:2-oxoacid:ferredoxin oxidoreductase subunit beta [Candidatus Neomarinimicrobiota bacterium]